MCSLYGIHVYLRPGLIPLPFCPGFVRVLCLIDGRLCNFLWPASQRELI